MANIAVVLKEEITRLARKAMRVETDPLKKAVAKYRSDIAALKRQNAELNRRLSELVKHAGKPAPPAADTAASPVRFSRSSLISHRHRLGLSQADLGILFGVSGNTIYNWESKDSGTRPRKEYLPMIAALRSLSKEDALAVVAQRKKL